MPPTTTELVERYGEPDDPYDDLPTNIERAGWALEALNAFAKLAHNNPDEQTYDYDDFPADVAAEVIGDLVCDLMHLALLADADPEDVIDRGQRHFLAEVGNGYDA